MAWNEPGGNNRDPWSGGGAGGGGRGNQGPPDLDEVIRKLKASLAGLFGARGKRSGQGGGFGGNNGERSGGAGGPSAKGVMLIVGLVVLGWLASGIYIVDEGTRGVVTRFGEFERISMPGPHWHIPYPVEATERVDVATRRTVTVGYQAVTAQQARPILSEALMLTQDENIVNVQLAVQYQVSDPEDFLFNFVDPEQTLKELTESALRETIGKREMDFILTEGRADVAQNTQSLINEGLALYQAGIQVIEVIIQDVQPPEQVQGAFEDAIRAREDRERLINQAQAYRNEIIPRAEGEAARILEDSLAYQARIVQAAEGESSRFSQQLAEYLKAPAVTRDRLYLDTMERVLGRSGKVLIDVEDNAPLMYLPLERMIRQSAAPSGDESTQGMSSNNASSFSSSGVQGTDTTASSRLRTRETR
ncbi:FtsH protease activity modulator HflK [Spiribacter sp. C176]|uniref:Protein HflK n=1 Tax=Spiribacter salilacus TaxID=2664894 RepID=A0A6N7QRK4_9GAMM|nr:FtsH protease activity modulator HflK [Spiribacter salilacus]MRH77778.1 FtsH protease activity modulator HflK [Spiribacter salilacus]